VFLPELADVQRAKYDSYDPIFMVQKPMPIVGITASHGISCKKNRKATI